MRKVVSLPIDHALDASKISCKYKINMIKRTQTAQLAPHASCNLAQIIVNNYGKHMTGIFLMSTRRLQRRSLRLPTRSKSAQTGHLCTTAQAGADPGIFVCRSKFPGLKVGRSGLD